LGLCWIVADDLFWVFVGAVVEGVQESREWKVHCWYAQLGRAWALERETSCMLSRAAQVIPSRDVKVAGLLGPAASTDKKSPAVSDSQTGIGGTTQWRLASLDTRTTLVKAVDRLTGHFATARGPRMSNAEVITDTRMLFRAAE
jgi:hypothetical protein